MATIELLRRPDEARKIATPAPPRKLTPRRRRRNWAIFGIVGAILATVVAVITRDVGITETPPTVQAPSLTQLNTAISMAETYLDGLYKPLDGGEATQSEFYGFPLKAHLTHPDTWLLLGQDETTVITPLEGDDESHERFRMTFGTALTVQADIDWNASRDTVSIGVTPEKVTDDVEVWLDTIGLASFTPGTAAKVERILPKKDLSAFRTLRYTVRHASQEAYMYYTARGDHQKADSLATFLRHNGYTPGHDMRAAVFNRSSGLPDDLPVNDDAYEDCTHLPAASHQAYAYESKACIAIGLYLGAGERDPFLQASQAIHTLQKYSPGHQYPQSFVGRWWLQGNTPIETAEHLQRQWARTGHGVPRCTPLDCDEAASGIRTFAFGILEAELGYRHGDVLAASYADAAAAVAISVQTRADGIIRTASGEVYRPAQIGGFPVYWDAQGRFAPPSPSLIGGAALFVAGEASMTPEYVGVAASNSETTFDAWAFLVRYRCVKYGVGCVL